MDENDKSSGEEDDTHKPVRSLNDFPDAILQHILSFLGTKLAVRTSVLCKKWEYMWTSLPSLDFKEENNMINFRNFVDRVFIFHNATRIQKFSLSCSGFHNVSTIKTWISAAVIKLNAKEFDLKFHSAYGNELPLSLFNSEAMEVLKISAKVFQVPSKISLPRLKILTLKDVLFKDQHSANILCAIPSLEELVIEKCRWLQEHKLIITAPELRYLTIDESCERKKAIVGSDSDSFSDDDSFSDVDYNDMDEGSSITISAPELKNFKYKGESIKSFHLPCSIKNATFEFYDFKGSDQIHVYCDEVLRSLKLVEYLKLSTSFLEAMSHVTVPVFENLISLELSKKPVDLSSKGVEMILNKCPCLEALQFSMGISKDCDFDRLLDAKFPFLSSSLKNITIGVFKGKFMETSVVTFLLKNATSLQNMKILCKIKNVLPRKHMVDVLSALPRASKSSKLDLHFV